MVVNWGNIFYTTFVSALILFTGENIFDLNAELRRWKQQFIQKHSADNLLEYDAKSLSFTQLTEEASVLPFLSEKRLLVIDGIPSIEAEQLDVLEQSIHPSVLVVLVSPSIDKRLKLNKELLKRADVHTFEPLDAKQLPQWVQTTAEQLGLTLTRELSDHLIKIVGTNQFALSSELQKLALYTGTVSTDVIEQLCIPHSDALIWELMDYIAQGNSGKALTLLRAIADKGESALGIWATFVWIASQLQLVTLAQTEGQQGFSQLTKEWGVKFGPAKLFTKLASAYGANSSTVCANILQADLALKTGQLQYTDQNQVEVQSCLDVYTHQLCQLVL